MKVPTLRTVCFVT